MDILVCVRPVREAGGGPWRMNHYDTFAVEEAVLLRERHPGLRVEAVSVGPAEAAPVLRRALGMGADAACHVVDEGEPREPHQVAALIAAAVARRTHHLVLAGVASEDAGHGQTGPLLAERLQRPCATAVLHLILDPAAGGRVSVEREVEGGARELLDLPLPAVLTLQSGINTPRYPALSRLLEANRQPLPTVEARDLGLPPPRLELARRTPPARTRQGIVLTGSLEEQALGLHRFLSRRGIRFRPGEVRP